MKNTYGYMIKQAPVSMDYCFMSFDFAMKHNWKLSDYVTVYAGKVDAENINEALEKLWDIFNVNRPETYFGRSLSVSDVVYLDCKPYYCDSFGWSECPESNK